MNKKLYYRIGRPFSPLYSTAMRIRERCYQRGIFRSVSFDVPVLSVGNLTMGGTGKTPMAQYLARRLQDNGYKPAIISRGYGGATKERINIVSDGHDILLDAAYVGDEPRMLAETLPGVLVLTGVVRKLPAARAVKMGADVLILDDGFQHLAIQRNLDLVLFSADALAGNSRVFPGGDLREPVKALHRCDAFIITGISDVNRERAGKFAELLRNKFPSKNVFTNGYRVAGIVMLDDAGARVEVEFDALEAHKCYGFCGIARPESFKQTLDSLELGGVGFESLADHHLYKAGEIRQLVKRAKQASATCLLCTEKDLVKLRGFDLGIPLYALIMAVEPDQKLGHFVVDRLAE